MAVLVGGAVLLWWLARKYYKGPESEHAEMFLDIAPQYEWLFWTAIGLLIITGIGNLGVFGASLPVPQTSWGARLAIKLLVVIAFVLLSLIRTVFVLRLNADNSRALSVPGTVLMKYMYGGTAITSVLIMVLAVYLAHG